ncbi:AlkA N-terminal domain-containing protein [Castellaniella sp. GW247-6E4]|uniref:DNA-3-methyladenine glycosylase family protein n=1 Tax=Castellaniella sp. GW247-6E4 TaxID=3140380 RepID=UPI0033157ED0
MKGRRLSCTLRLPPDFRAQEVLAFHRRDREGLAERVEGDCMRKGLVWHGEPACLSLRLAGGRATAELAVDGDVHGSADESARFAAMLRRLLGLDQDIDAFEALYLSHPLIGPLLAPRRGLRVPMAATPFEALTWAITGQQISVAVAISLRRKLVRAVDIRHSSGLWCHPDATAAAALDEDILRAASFSAAKARTLSTLSRAVADGSLPLEDWLRDLPIEAIRSGLLAIKGIGPWTVDYALLRGFGWLDGSLHGDVAVRRGIQALLGAPERIGEAQAREWLLPFAPWRALLAAHLWAAQSDAGY